MCTDKVKMTYSRKHPTNRTTVLALRCALIAAVAVYGCSTPAPVSPPPVAEPKPVAAAVPPPPPAEPAAPPIVAEKPAPAIVDENNVFFAPGSTAVDDAGNDKLRQCADRLKQNPKQHVILRGYADELGSRSVSLALTEQRLSAVSKALRGYGASPRQIRRNRVASVKKPVSCAATGCRQPLGRVEMVYSP